MKNIKLLIPVLAITLIFTGCNTKKEENKDLGCKFDGELVEGAEYVNGQYTYSYMKIDDGWKVKLTDSNSKDPVTTKLCSTINGKPIVSMNRMFADSQATSIDLSSFDTSNVTAMIGMFANSQAESINLSKFNTSKVVIMESMFDHSQAKILDLSSFDTSSVEYMEGMFDGSNATTCYAKTQNDADKLNDSYGKPDSLTCVVK